MTRRKLAVLGFCAVVVGIMAMSASSAQAVTVSWLVLNGAKTVATNLLAQVLGKTDSTHLTLDGEVAGLKIAVTCTNFILKEWFIAPVEKFDENGKAVFTGCKVYKAAPLIEEYKCTVNSPGAPAGTIETNALKGLLELVGTKLLARVEALAGPAGSIVTIQFTGPECVLPESVQLHGTAYVEDCQGQATTHKLEHLVQPDSVSATKIYIGGVDSAKQLEVTKLLGSVWVFLGGAHVGLEWSGMDV
jgi:hypothetical protein